MNNQSLAGAVQAKYWGQTQCIFSGPYSETHYLEIKNGGYCSEHSHKFKWNRFFLISGRLLVRIYNDDGGFDDTILEPGHFTDVPPDTVHYFLAEEDCRCLETYWIDNISEDIIRRRSGGTMYSSAKFNPQSHEQAK